MLIADREDAPAWVVTSEKEKAERLAKNRKRSGHFTPEKIVEKFFAGELCHKDGTPIDSIGDMSSPEIRVHLLDCLKRYKIKSP